jgi:hypothetical protein
VDVTLIMVSPRLDQELVPGVANSYVFQIQNLGDAYRFTISATDNQEFLQTVSPVTLTLSTNQSANVTVQMQAPTSAAPGLSDILTLMQWYSGNKLCGAYQCRWLPDDGSRRNGHISPKMWPVGTTVTITGTGFRDTQGAGVVTFNGVSAGLASPWSATSITVVVPSGATTGNVVVTVVEIASNGINFKVH